jgi:hypothetical protein
MIETMVWKWLYGSFAPYKKYPRNTGRHKIAELVRIRPKKDNLKLLYVRQCACHITDAMKAASADKIKTQKRGAAAKISISGWCAGLATNVISAQGMRMYAKAISAF